MSDHLLLIAVRTDREDVGLPVRGILHALKSPTAIPAHVTVLDPGAITAEEKERLATIFGRDNPDAFQVLDDLVSA